jgi:hypothetical protein
MNYLSGHEVCVGDNVIADKSEGVIVCVIDTKQFTEKYPEWWAYLENGCLVETKEMGLVHYPESDEDLILKNRR